jgi:hypothetical protein
LLDTINNTAERVVEQFVNPRNSLSTEAKHSLAERVVEQIVNPKNVIVDLGFDSVDNEFLGVAIFSTTISDVLRRLG